ncbi:bacterial alpha-L-rhamnosidase-domain-containing protein [Microdochium trichocladiopsis]|uniref:alpha-L-rhamnosidase n=1 Tax=Microdochium trichocladiopsis TaxID=1682393 RepID=A0A9P9BTL0_9PEZI|nr:bacterial alpha-L-rhamnosidase-domain-containing protein [Microdochium trichocladiopsis]KAH7030574.1 bacterial alpha-L-rhamnosidase-domain-containing protein [Microdochium trichocladiopsis]
MGSISNLRFEHYRDSDVLGRHDRSPRLSWTFINASSGFRQVQYELEICEDEYHSTPSTYKIDSDSTVPVPWPHPPLRSRQRVSVRARAWGEDDAIVTVTPWSESVSYEAGLLERDDWTSQRITAPWAPGTSAAGPEQLYRKVFQAQEGRNIARARLYITAQGVYEAEINGRRVGDHFMAPGWTTYSARLQYQTYDVSALLRAGEHNCLAVRVAEGWFSGRIGFEGGRRNIWGPHTALLAQLEMIFEDGTVEAVGTDMSWIVTRGPIRLAEIYDGEKYDARLEVPGWAEATNHDHETWEPVLALDTLPLSVALEAGCSEPVRRVDVVKPIARLCSPSGKTILDFGQNLVGYNIAGQRGHKITLRHAEVLEGGELGTRPLRECQATDEYILRGPTETDTTESYEPRFTFHGFRYAQIDGWLPQEQSDPDSLLSSIEAVVCHTDMEPVGTFSSSHELLNKLYCNVTWSLRGNFLSVPTDCPQRDERLGWSGDLAVFAPTATLLYDCFDMLKNWLVDVEHDQTALSGVPAFVTPDSMLTDPAWCRKIPCAVWNDVTVLAPWALYEETGDVSVLAEQYRSMKAYLSVVPREKDSYLWDSSIFQLAVSFLYIVPDNPLTYAIDFFLWSRC